MNSQILEDLFSMNNHVFEINLAGITSKESLQLPITGGNCINWVVGHLIVSAMT